MELSRRQLDQYAAQEFLGLDTWNAWKRDLDSMLAFRNMIKSKPDQYQAAELALNAPFINFYKTVLFHSGHKDCTCRRCELERNDLR